MKFPIMTGKICLTMYLLESLKRKDPYIEITMIKSVNQLLVSVWHLCDLLEHFGKKTYESLILWFIDKLSWILTNYIQLERGDLQL